MYPTEKASLSVSMIKMAVERRKPPWPFMTTRMRMFLNEFWNARRARTLNPMAVILDDTFVEEVLFVVGLLVACSSTSPLFSGEGLMAADLRETAVVGSIVI